MSTTDGGSANPYISIIMAIPETNTPATGRAVARGDHVYLIDASGYVFRAYHALPPLTRPSDGLPVGAVHGFCGMLWKLLRETGELDPPTHIAAIFDLSEHTFRNELYSDYKANRSEAPDDLIPQFPLIRDAVHAFNVACIEKRGYEADDLIATYAREAAEAGAEVTIVSSDKDLMQLVRPGVRMYDTMKNKLIGEAEVMERFGVPPSKVVEVQSLIGDSTDNVPGVPGIGVKTAALLINEFGDLETLLDRASEIKQDKRRESLITFADQARLSKALVILDTHVPLDVALAETAVHAPDAEALTAFMRKLEFTTLLRRVAEGLGAELPEGMTPSSTPQRKKKDDYDHPLRRSPRGPAVPPQRKTEGGSPAQLAVERGGTARSHALRPVQLRDRDRRGQAHRPARGRALSGPFLLQGEADFVRSHAGRTGGRGARDSCRDTRPMCRWRIARATGSISAATRSRKFPCARLWTCSSRSWKTRAC